VKVDESGASKVSGETAAKKVKNRVLNKNTSQSSLDESNGKAVNPAKTGTGLGSSTSRRTMHKKKGNTMQAVKKTYVLLVRHV
jgi:hypothetical protein